MHKRHLLSISTLFAAGILLAISFSNVTDYRLFFIFLILYGSVSYAIFFKAIWKATNLCPIVNVGTFYSFVATSYILIPAFSYLLRGLYYGPDSDIRLFLLQPNPSDILLIYWQGLVYISCFNLIFYLCTRNRPHNHRVIKLSNIPSANKYIFMSIVLTLYFYILEYIYPVSSKLNTDRYLAFWSMPLIVQQISTHLFGILSTLLIILTIIFTSNYPKYKYYLYALLIYISVDTLVAMGSRTEMVQLLIAAILIRHILIKPIIFKKLVTICMAGLIFVLAYGGIRSAVVTGSNYKFGTNLITSANEFESIIATAYELFNSKNNGTLPKVPPLLYVGDFTSMIPQQLLPFDKIIFDKWYIENFHPDIKLRGGGLAFGVLAESIVGLGLVELILKGFIIGFVFSKIHNWYQRYATSFWATAVYLWIILHCYQSFRFTSFVLITLFVFHFIPVYLAEKMMPTYRKA